MDKEAITQLNNNKAAGIDGLAPELLKFGPGELIRIVHRVVVQIRETEELPDEWKDGVIRPIYKKGDKLDCENYRAITITNAAYKILSQILFRRLSPLVNRFVGSYQAGFTDGLNTPPVHRFQSRVRLDRSSTAMANSARIQLPQKDYKIDTGNDEWSAEQRSNIRCLIGSIRMP